MSNDERNELRKLEQLADDANLRMNRFQDEMAAAITDLAFKHFIALQNMDAAFIRQFGSILSSNTWRITQDLDSLNYAVKHSQK